MYILDLFFKYGIGIILNKYLFHIPVTYFVSQDVDGCKTRRRIGLSERVRGTEFSYDARILFGTDATNRRETCVKHEPRDIAVCLLLAFRSYCDALYNNGLWEEGDVTTVLFPKIRWPRVVFVKQYIRHVRSISI